MKPSMTSRPRPPVSGRPATGTTAAASRSAGASVGRFAARKRARRWAGVRPLVVGLGVALALAGMAWVALASPLLGVREVRVEGARTISAARVVAAAGVERGTPLARVDTARAAAGVTALAEVGAVEISRQLPGTVVVHIVERSPVAVVRSGSSLRLVDGDGVAYLGVASAPAGLPLVEALGTPEAAALRAAVTAVRSLPPDLRVRVAGVSAGGPQSVVLRLRDGRRVVWGSPADSARKAEVLAALVRARRAAVYDVSAPEVPTTRAR